MLKRIIAMVRPEVIVNPSTPMPKGYGFLKKGYAYKTAMCRRETHAANRTLFVVKDKSQILGLRAPIWILRKVGEAERESRAERRENVAKRDDQMDNRFRQTLERMYPRIPQQDIGQIVTCAMRKRSGRVGRTSTLPLEKKVHLAVAAHARHRHTNYERLVREMSRDKARTVVFPVVKKIVTLWKGETGSEEDPILLDESSSDVEIEEENGDHVKQNSPQEAPSDERTGKMSNTNTTASQVIPIRERGESARRGRGPT
ncbi:hypothetical protein HJFPF1_08809 [Paramyrothecium foliicola]|nr:hypothetical protein HJFPF1_08809 [Paramyrothecium foliicola]